MNVHDRTVLEKINKYAKQCLVFLGDMDLSEFTKDEKTVSACVFCLSQIGELVSKLSDEYTKSTSEIPWQKIKGLRNRIVHDYEGVQLNMIWDVMKDFLPDLLDISSPFG